MRSLAGLSQRELGARAGVDASTIARVEGGGPYRPSWSTIRDCVHAAGFRFALVDSTGEVVTAAWLVLDRDRSGRRFPAHLQTWRVTSPAHWWFTTRQARVMAPDEVPEVTFTKRRLPLWRKDYRAMKHVGILAHSVEGAALCFRELGRYAATELGNHLHPDVTIDCIAMGHSMPAWDSGDHAAIRTTLANSVSRLARAGADFFVCPDNTAHLALELSPGDLDLPGLHIAQVVADRAVADGRQHVGILGTSYTMDGPIYPRTLTARGIRTLLPGAADRGLINDVIFGELVKGVVRDESRAEFVRIIGELRDAGCDSVALVCTEIPLLVEPEVSPLPTLDSTRLLARAATDVALGRRDLPTWRGGPLS